MVAPLLTESERTTLAGTIRHEVNCVAVINEESSHLLAVMTKEAMQPKHVTKFINEDLASGHAGYVQPGTFGAMNAMRGFIVSSSYVCGLSQVLTLLSENQQCSRPQTSTTEDSTYASK